MYTAGTGWLRERRVRREKASRSIGLKGARNPDPEAGFDKVKFKIGFWRSNEPTVREEASLEHRRYASVKASFQWRCQILELDHRVGWSYFQRCTTREPMFSKDMSVFVLSPKICQLHSLES